MNASDLLVVEPTQPGRMAAMRLASDARAWRPIGAASLALGVCVAYYVGAEIGLLLRVPATTPSVMWPPNGILTAALLLTPVRYWPWCLLGALPAHLWLELGQGWPVPFVLTLFL